MNKPLQVFNFSVQNASNDEVDVHVDGEIVDANTQAVLKNFWGDDTSVSFKSFRNQIEEAKPKVLNVYVNSPGGHVGDALAMHDYLIELESKGVTVNRRGRGVIASAGTYLVMGNNSELSENSHMMIHNISMVAVGEINQVENQVRAGRKFNDSIRDFYANHTGIRKEDITKMMDNETWMTAEEAKAKGFVKNITGKVEFKNAIPREQWQYSNTAVLNAYNSAVKTPPQHDTSFFQNQIDEMKNWIKNALGIKDTKLPENADKQEILNAVVDGLVPHLEKLDEEVQTEITNKVNEVLTSEAFTNAIAEAVKPFEDKIAALEQKNSDLETDIKNKIGQPTSTIVNKKDELKAVGTYVNEN